MKRTKDGGVVLIKDEGEIKLTKAEFLQRRIMRDFFRIGIVLVTATIDFIFIKSNGLLTIGAICLMLGWRLKVGW